MDKKQKKVYVAPKMTTVEVEASQPLLCESSGNAYWGGCWEEPAEDYWKN